MILVINPLIQARMHRALAHTDLRHADRFKVFPTYHPHYLLGIRASPLPIGPKMWAVPESGLWKEVE